MISLKLVLPLACLVVTSLALPLPEVGNGLDVATTCASGVTKAECTPGDIADASPINDATSSANSVYTGASNLATNTVNDFPGKIESSDVGGPSSTSGDDSSDDRSTTSAGAGSDSSGSYSSVSSYLPSYSTGSDFSGEDVSREGKGTL